MLDNDLTAAGQMTEQEIIEAIKKNWAFIHKVEKTPERCMAAVKQSGYALKWIPKSMHTVDLCMEAVKQDGNSLRHVSRKMLTYTISLEAIKQSGRALAYVMDNFKDRKLCLEAIRQDGTAIRYVPQKYINQELYSEAVNSNGMVLECIPRELLTKELCLKAVKQNGESLIYVPSRLKTKKLCLVAIENAGQALAYVPNRYRTQEFCLKAIVQNGRALEYVPESVCTVELCLEALQQDIAAAKYIPEKLNSEKTIIEAEKQYEVRKVVKKIYSKETNKFYVVECIFRESEEKEFDTFSEFYYYIEGDLSDADLYEYDFENIDLSRINIEGAKISNSVLRKQGLYDDAFYAENIRKYSDNVEIRFSTENDMIEASAILHAEDFDDATDIDSKKIYYISDIHINHKILNKFPEYATKEEIITFIRKFVYKMTDTAEQSLHSSYLFITGDVSFNFELSKIFYTELVEKWDPSKTIVVLGNHELWDFNQYGQPAQYEGSVDDIISQYRHLFESLGMIFLQNDLLIYKDYRLKIITEKQLTGIDITFLREICLNSSFMVLGGLGYSGYNEDFNATHGIYRKTILTLPEDMEQTKRFEDIYEKVETALEKNRLIILTHTPKENWTNKPYNSNWIYVNGHTHRNDYTCSKEKTVYADNQIGYYSNSIGLKHFCISCSYDIFGYYKDGIYKITREQYLDFNRGIGINITFNRTHYIIYMLKNRGVYCFLAKRKEKLYFLEGGNIRNLINDDIDYYFDNLSKYSDVIKKQLRGYNTLLKAISQAVKAIGGKGTIHGCIIDIDFYNHIYLNLHDGEITPYYATAITDKYVYNNIQALLQERRSDLYDNYLYLLEKSDKVNSLITSNKNAGTVEPARFVGDTYIYRPSRIMKTLQYITNVNVVRVWDDRIIEADSYLENQENSGLLE